MTSKVAVQIIEPMTSKWRQKCRPLQIIEPLTEKTWGQGCVIRGERKNKKRKGETPLRRRKYFEWIINQLLNSALVGYEEFCRSRRCYPPRPSASVDNTLLDLQNTSYPTQPHSIIAKYALKYSSQVVKYSKVCMIQAKWSIRPMLIPVSVAWKLGVFLLPFHHTRSLDTSQGWHTCAGCSIN